MTSDRTREILDLETRYWQAMKDKDVDTALSMTADPCIVTGAQGVSRIDKGAYRKLMEGGTWELRSFRFDDVEVLELSDDMAIIGYNVTEDLLVDGKPITFTAADASTWVRKDGEWVCALHTESPKGDPFGRAPESH